MSHEKSRCFITTSVLLTTLVMSGCLSSGGSGASGPVSDAESNRNTGNTPPEISGTPQRTTLTGSEYSFIPAASDADGDSLRFSIENRPRWAAFNTSTGELSGQPMLGDIGAYEDIVITVSDGTSTDSLPAFSLSVTQTASASFSLSWDAPTQYTDGTTISSLAGYRVLYGSRTGRYTEELTIDNPSVTTAVIDGVSPGRYYVVLTAFSSNGTESGYSSEIVKTAD